MREPTTSNQDPADSFLALQTLQADIAEWQVNTFPNQKLDGKLAHLVSEAKELRENPHDMKEWGDVMILLLGAAAMSGLIVDDLVSAARAKFDLAKNRKWGPANADGFHHHLEEA